MSKTLEFYIKNAHLGKKGWKIGQVSLKVATSGFESTEMANCHCKESAWEPQESDAWTQNDLHSLSNGEVEKHNLKASWRTNPGWS